MLEDHLDDTEKHLEIVETAWIGTGIVGHEEEEKDEDKILHAEGEPVDAAPACILGENAGKETGNEHSKEQTGDNDRKCSSTSPCWGKITDKREHQLRCNRHCGCDEREGEEDAEVICQTQAEPLLKESLY